MSKIYTFSNQGGAAKIGMVNVNQLDVDPTAVVAGTDTITKRMLQDYNMFDVTAAAATDNVLLNDDIEIGSFFVLYVGANGMEIIGGGAGLLNGGTAAQVIDIAADSRAEVFKSAADAYTVEQVTAAGARTAPSPATDG